MERKYDPTEWQKVLAERNAATAKQDADLIKKVAARKERELYMRAAEADHHHKIMLYYDELARVSSTGTGAASVSDRKNQ